MISIAMATYNGAKYLREQIDSILAQTIQDFELIVCDDCSSDETWDILKQYSDADKRIKVFQNESNLGFKRNFEKAMLLCSGEYIALSDQDDIWLPDHLEILLNNMGDSMLSAGNSELVDGKGDKIGLKLNEMESLAVFSDNSNSRALSFFLFRNPIQGASMIIRRDFLSVALPIPDDVNYHDAWFSCLSCFYGNQNYTFRVVTNYRMHEHNVTGHRVKPKSRVRHLCRSLLFDSPNDRKAMIRTIRKRVDNLTNTQVNTLDLLDRILKRNKSFIGRIQNALFRISHFRIIYSIFIYRDCGCKFTCFFRK